MATTQGFTLWFTGMSGAGKSTLAHTMADLLRARGHLVEVLDGDEVRQTLCKDLGFSHDNRVTNARRIGFVTRLLSRNGVVAITAAISPYREVRDEIRQQHDAPFLEVFVDCALAELVRRDVKGLYARALRGDIAHFTGVNDIYEAPVAPEIHVQTDKQTIEESIEQIVSELCRRSLIERVPSH